MSAGETPNKKKVGFFQKIGNFFTGLYEFPSDVANSAAGIHQDFREFGAGTKQTLEDLGKDFKESADAVTNMVYPIAIGGAILGLGLLLKK